jgi:hypothetical protein
MSRLIAVMACGFSLAACSSSMPSLDFLRGSPPTEQLRVESEPPGADARTSQGQSCRTPCELTVPSGGELSVTVAMNGFQPQTVPVRAESASAPGTRDSDSTGSIAHLQPNPVYVELQPAAPAKKRPAAPAKKKSTTAAAPARVQTQAAGPAPVTGSPTTGANYPWPAPQ